MDMLFVANSGSSSVKFQIFAIEAGDTLRREIKGQMDGIGTHPRLRAQAGDGTVLVDRNYDTRDVMDVSHALQTTGAWLREELQIQPIGVGHRVVHGGSDYDAPVVLNHEVLTRLETYIPLAPLHQPYNLAPIRSIMARFPELLQVACFDTAFHRSHGPLADYYAIPYQLHAEGIRRYGFHGLSYEYIAMRMREVAPDVAKGRVIVAHLGSGASLCAMENGRSIDSTLGFTALDGLPMGTRPGQIDPGVILHLLTAKGMTPKAIQDFLYRDCGLKGLSGISNDIRALEASDDPRAAFAIEYFAHRTALNAGMLATALQGIDGFVFTAGIGENSAGVRAKIIDKLGWLGAQLDPAANSTNAQTISRPESRFPIFAIPTDEELMIARHTLAVLSHVDSARTVEGAA